MTADGLTLEGLSAGYGPLRVLHDLDLQIARGSRVGVVGLNGHGKSTLLRSVAGLAGWSSGRITWCGVRLDGRRPDELVRLGVVIVPQGDALFPGISVRENIEAGAYAKDSWPHRRKRLPEVLAVFPPLQALLPRAAGTLSGGERRMVSLARSLMRRADLYLVDEPSLGLAQGIATTVVARLMTADLHDRTVVIAEQNRTLIEPHITALLRMHCGRLEPAQEPPNEDLPAQDTRRQALS